MPKVLKGHHTDKCESGIACDKCINLMLHIDNYKSYLNPDAKPFSGTNSSRLNSNNQSLSVNKNVSFVSAQCPVQLINVKDVNGDKREALVFEDSGSDVCLIRKDFAQRLVLHGEEITLNMLLAGGERKIELSETFPITVSPIDYPLVEKSFKVFVVQQPCSDPKKVSVKSLEKFSHLKPLIDKLYLDG
ncbi:hypothetical protein LOTGIDRAFT_176524, partial [Lottia gigantea]